MFSEVPENESEIPCSWSTPGPASRGARGGHLHLKKNRKNETKWTPFSACQPRPTSSRHLLFSHALLMYRNDGGNIASNCSEVQQSDVEAFSPRRVFSFASRTSYWNSFCTCTASALGVKEALSFGIILAVIFHFLKTVAAARFCR